MLGQVLVAFEFGAINGGENSFLAVVDTLRDTGWNFTGLAPPNTPLESLLRARGLTTLPFQQVNSSGQRLSQADRRELFAAAINAAKPDLVHCNSLSMSRLCGPVCRELSVPSLGYLRDIIKLSRRAIEDINQLDRIVAVSHATRDFHLQQGLSDEKSVAIRNGIDAGTFLANRGSDDSDFSIRHELSVAADTPLLLYCGQIGMRKGIDTLVDAFLQLAELRHEGNLPAPHLLIAGERHSQKQEAIEYEQVAQQRIADSTFAAQVHWLGRRGDIAAVMQQCTLLIHPARQEPLGRVLLEAAAVGLPIIATDVGGTAEILAGPPFNSLLVPVDDAGAIVKLADELLNDARRRRELSTALEQLIGERFSVAQCATQLQREYARLA